MNHMMCNQLLHTLRPSFKTTSSIPTLEHKIHLATNSSISILTVTMPAFVVSVILVYSLLPLAKKRPRKSMSVERRWMGK